MKKTIQLNTEQIKEVTEELEIGLKVFYNFKTQEIISLFDPDLMFDDLPEYMDELIEDSPHDFFELEKMTSTESFRVMEDFVINLKDSPLRNKLFNHLEKPKPFRNFKFEVENSDVREEWFSFKSKKWMEHIIEQVDLYNELGR